MLKRISFALVPAIAVAMAVIATSETSAEAVPLENMDTVAATNMDSDLVVARGGHRGSGHRGGHRGGGHGHRGHRGGGYGHHGHHGHHGHYGHGHRHYGGWGHGHRHYGGWGSYGGWGR